MMRLVPVLELFLEGDAVDHFERRGRVSWTLVAILLLAVALGLGWTYTAVRAQEARARAEEAARAAAQARQAAGADDLSGKVVFVETGKLVAVLEKCRVRQLGDRSFLEGQVVDDKSFTNGAFAGTTMLLPVSDITRLVTAENLEQLQRGVKAK
jgi:hypothetical protein